jgi:hypothetical protein
LSKALYGLKQAQRAWYECLRDFLIEKGLTIGKVDTILFTKKLNKKIFICQVYVDDIIFDSTNEDYDWRAYILFWFSSQANERRDFHLSRKVYQGSSQGVQNG